jgi:hypothetical protein
MAQYVGQYFSKEYVQKEILKMSDDDVNLVAKQIEGEAQEVEPQPYEEGEPNE